MPLIIVKHSSIKKVSHKHEINMNIREEVMKVKGYKNNSYKVGGYGGYNCLHNGRK